MGSGNARRMVPDRNEEYEADDRYEELMQRYESLRSDAAEVVRENKALQQRVTVTYQFTAGVYLVLLSFLVLGRLLLYGVVEDGGMALDHLGIVLNLLFASGAVALLVAWVQAEWKEIAWLAVAKYIYVFVMLIICAKLFSDGALLRGDFDAAATHPALAGLVAIVACITAASPFFVVAVRTVFQFLNDVFKGGGGV